MTVVLQHVDGTPWAILRDSYGMANPGDIDTVTRVSSHPEPESSGMLKHTYVSWGAQFGFVIGSRRPQWNGLPVQHAVRKPTSVCSSAPLVTGIASPPPLFCLLSSHFMQHTQR